MSTIVVEPKVKTQNKRQPPYHVIVFNDDYHTFEYVVEMLKSLFGHPVEKGFRMAEEIHKKGCCIVDTTTRERAELKQDQVQDYGPDYRVKNCNGSMRCEIEAAE